MDLNLSTAHEGALADIEAANAGSAPAAPTPEVVETAPETPAAAAVEEATPPVSDETPAPAAQATPVESKEEPVAQKWTFTRKGQQVEITDAQQAAELIRQGYDYTQKTMELAEYRRQAEAHLRQVLTNPQLLRAQLAEIERLQGPVAPAPQAPAPDDLVTVEQHQQLLRAQLEQTQRQTQAYVNQALLRAETNRYAEEYTGEVNRHMSVLTGEKFPILKDVDKIEKLILDDVSDMVKARIAMNPETPVEIGEVKTLIAQVAEKRATKLQARLKEHQKMEAVRAAKVTKQGIEPAGGAPPAPKASPSYKLNDPRLTELIISDLTAAFKK